MKLHRLQRLALLPMSPARSQTPTAGMEILANVTPLTIHIQEMALRAYIRIKSYLPAWDNLGKLNLRGHLFKIMKQANKLNISLDNLDKIPLTFQPKNSLKLELTDFGTIPPPPENSLLIYTDGSKTMEGIGAGFAVYQTDTTHRTFQLIHSNHYKLPPYATVFQAEVEAINQGAKFALDIVKHNTINLQKYGDLSTHEIYFIGDNRASLHAITNRVAKSQIVLNCTKNLSDLNTTHKTILHWIKAHVGNEGNEKADALAKLGTSLTLPHTPLPNNPNFLPTPIPLSHVKNITREQSQMEWNLQWANSPHYRQTKIFFPKVDPVKSGHLLRLNREDFGRAIRWLTGHCFLNRHNHLLYPLDYPSPTCRACGWEQETSSHIICQCEALGRIRFFHFQEFLLPLAPIPLIRQLTSFLTDPRIKTLETLPPG
jgi:ribonuclease HI